MGEVWERRIRSGRSVLVTLLKIRGTSLNDESLCTFFAEVEAIVNTRPITSESLSDVHSPAPLCPVQLLTMKQGLLCHPQESSRKKTYCRKHWRRVQHLADKCWSRWKMQPYKFVIKGTKLLETLRLETLLWEETSRNKWPVGRVIAIQECNDGFVRSVNIVVGTNASKTFGTRIATCK